MRHRVKKVKFKKGKDANKMLMRKLAVNFLVKGHLVTTKAKASSLVGFLERLTHKAKAESESNKNFMLKNLGNTPIIKQLFKEIGPVAKTYTSGYFKKTMIGPRASDGSQMVRIEWSIPVVLPGKEEVKQEKQIKEKVK